jgi:hypothetical protein
MVENDFIKSVEQSVEQLLYNKFDVTDEIFLFIPLYHNYSEIKYNLIVSSKKIDNISIRKIINEIFNSLDQQKQKKINKIDIMSSNENLMNNLKFIAFGNNDLYEINNIRVGDVYLEKAYLYKTKR